jgi:hypothetical protein
MKHQIYLNFTISDYEDITHSDISDALGMKPYKVYVKGEKRNLNSSSDTPLLWKFNRWIMAPPLDEYCTFEDQMNATLDIIEPKIDLFKPFCEKYSCEFSCAIYLRYDNGESIPSVYLDSRYNRLIKELNIGFDIDLYTLPNEE